MKTRLLSAIVMIVVIVPLLIIGGIPFYIGITLIGFFGFRELLALKKKDKLPTLIIIFSYISFLLLMLSGIRSEATTFFIDYKILTAIIFFMLFPLVFYHDNKKYNINDALFLIGSIFFLGIAFNYLITVRIFDLKYLIFLLLITIITDTFAYLTGKLIGKNKLCPSISPNKSIEGLIGGSIMGTYVSTIFYITFFNYTGNVVLLVVVILLLSLVGQLGDLIFSSIKRQYKIKDFSNLIPGHGGILDRLDSILFVILAFSFIVGIL